MPELTSPAEIAEAGEPENVTLAGDPDKGRKLRSGTGKNI